MRELLRWRRGRCRGQNALVPSLRVDPAGAGASPDIESAMCPVDCDFRHRKSRYTPVNGNWHLNQDSFALNISASRNCRSCPLPPVHDARFRW